jgi:hypothetical protein
VRRFAIRIRELCSQQGWSQERLAEEAGIHRTYLGGIETAPVAAEHYQDRDCVRGAGGGVVSGVRGPTGWF